MLFDANDISRRSRFSKRRSAKKKKSVTNVRLKAKGQRGGTAHRVAVCVLVPTVIAAVCVLGWYSTRGLGRSLFSRNKKFLVKNVNVVLVNCTSITQKKVEEWCRIREDMNLFEFNISAIRKKVLANARNVRSLEIRRFLPGTVEIEVEERKAVARVGHNSAFVVDQDGYVFVNTRDSLCELEGVRIGTRKVKPGDRLPAIGLAALDVLKFCDNPSVGLSVRAVDVSESNQLVLFLVDARPIDLKWKGIGTRTEESRRNMLNKIMELATTVGNDRAGVHKAFDATRDDGIIGRG